MKKSLSLTPAVEMMLPKLLLAEAILNKIFSSQRKKIYCTIPLN